MSLHSAIIERARSFAPLNDLIDGRISFEFGSALWKAPYVVLSVGGQDIDLTFGPVGGELSKSRITARLYASTVTDLDLLEKAWRGAFDRYSDDTITAWVISASNSAVRITDSENRMVIRSMDMIFAAV